MYAIYSDNDLVYSTELTYSGDRSYSVINPKLTMEINKTGSLEFTLPYCHYLFNANNKLKKMTSLIKVKEDGVTKWEGRIISIEKDFYNRKKLYCEGILAWLYDSIQEPVSFNNKTVNDVLTHVLKKHNEQMKSHYSTPFSNSSLYIGKIDEIKDKTINIESKSYMDTFSFISTYITDVFEGFFILAFNTKSNRYELDYISDKTVTSTQTIEFGINLLDFKDADSIDDLATILIPLGTANNGKSSSQIDLSSVKAINDSNWYHEKGSKFIEYKKGVEQFGKIWKQQTWNNIKDATTLLSKSQDFLKKSSEIVSTLTIKAIDLHMISPTVKSISLGEMIRVVSKPHNVDKAMRCSKITINLQDPEKNEYIIGDIIKALTDQQIEKQKVTNTE